VPDSISDTNTAAPLGGTVACSLPQDGSQYPWTQSDPLSPGGPKVTDAPS